MSVILARPGGFGIFRLERTRRIFLVVVTVEGWLETEEGGGSRTDRKSEV